MPARPYTVFMLLKATTRWLALDRAERDEVYDGALMRVYNHFPSVRVRFFDSSGFSGRCSDVLMWETTDMPEYRDAVASLHEHAFFGQPCFEIVEVIPSVPDGWREFDWETGRACAA